MKLVVDVDLEFLDTEYATINEYVMTELCNEVRLVVRSALKQDEALRTKIKEETEKYLVEHIHELISKSCGTVIEGVVKKVAGRIVTGNRQVKAAVVNRVVEVIGS